MAALDSRYCPVAALQRHLGSRIRGPVFMRLDHAAETSIHTGDNEGIQGRTIARLIQAAARGIGLDPKLFGGHSARRTMATLASRAGAPIDAIQQTGGWRKASGVSPYIEDGQRRKNAVTGKVLG